MNINKKYTNLFIEKNTKYVLRKMGLQQIFLYISLLLGSKFDKSRAVVQVGPSVCTSNKR